MPTHYQNPVFPNSRSFDLLRDDPEPLLSDVETVIFCAGVEQSAEATPVESAMKRLLAGCHDKRFVYLSSDAIFAGDRGLYSEDETPEPVTAYGRTLLLCETLVRETCPNHLIVRPSYIYGFSRGKLDSRLTRTLNAVNGGATVSLFEDMYKSPLGVQQVAEAVVQLSQHEVTGTLHVAGARLSVLEFHKQALAALGHDTRALCGTPMPKASLLQLQRDTSLDSSKWQKLSETRPLSIPETLQHRH